MPTVALAPTIPAFASRIRKVCSQCGSDQILADAWAAWNVERQCWEIADVMDKGHICNGDCGGETRIIDAAVPPDALSAVKNAYAGVAFCDILDVIAKGRDDYDLAAVEAAREMSREGELEVDASAITSRCEDSDGCYVQCWRWVPRSHMNLPDPPALDGEPVDEAA